MKVKLLISCAFLIGATGLVNAGDPAAGKTKAAACAACHGQVGISSNDEWPNLAGQKETYLIKQITAFREGGRTDALMNSMVKRLSDKDVADLATYYAGLKPES